MAEEKYNLKNSAVKRILQEVKEMQSNPSDDFMSLPLEENIFEWQFAISGPRDTEFEGGIYHGRIQLPAEYPFKPPGSMLFSPNGRFETQTKICLSISNHHPEHWQPSWSGIIEGDSGVCDQPDIQSESSVVRVLLLVQGNSSMADDTRAAFKHIPTEGHKVMEKLAEAWGGQSGYADSEWLDTFLRTALVALIAFMPTNPDGALGSLDYTKEERHALAIKSREAAPKFGTPERQKLMDEIHQYMLSKAPPVAQLTPLHPSDDNSTSRDGGAQASPENAVAVAAIEEHPNLVPEPRIVENVREVHMNANAGPLGVTAGFNMSRQVTDVGPSEQQRRLQVKDSKTIEDRLFTLAAIGLTLAIAFLLVKKYMKANGYAI